MKPKSLTDLVAEGVVRTPSRFYRSQHPDLFSDSKEKQTTSLPPDLFVFHLDQLTTAKREREFEDFARRLCEREICPNLLTQTGPTGGGDSKTDSSTYPVAPELGIRRWWIGHTMPSDEDWAFAFSCKHDWRSKIRSDIAKIALLPRQFTRAYFVTNQAVKDRSRSEMEEELREKHNLDVRILDRTWIVERVNTNRHEALAIDALGLQLGSISEKRLGPNDEKRTRKLEELLEKLRQAAPLLDNYALAHDYLTAAKLSSSLERPRNESDGLFLRARELAISSGELGLVIRTHYVHAWRTFFWLDDPATAERIFNILLIRTKEINDAELMELLMNLCSILETASRLDTHKCDDSILHERRSILEAQLQKIVSDRSRPNNSLHAETLLISSDKLVAFSDRNEMEKIFKKLTRIFRRAHGLGTYPIFHFMEVWQKAGEFFCDWPGYAELQAEMQSITAKRYGESQAGEAQIEFGFQLLEKDKLPEALTQLSSARFLLRKEETIDQSISAALGCAVAYRKMGHVWASRLETLVAAQFALGSREKIQTHPERAYLCALRMAWTELGLGRLTPFLAWRNLSSSLARILIASGDPETKYTEDLESQDAGLGCIFLKITAAEALPLEGLADKLEDMGLHISRMCLLHSCGRPPEVIFAESISYPELDSLLDNLRSQPIFDEVGTGLTNDGRAEQAHTLTLLGVDFHFSHQNTLGPTLISESLTGMFDAAFALAKLENFAIVFDKVSISTVESHSGHYPPSAAAFQHDPISELKQVWGPDAINWIHGSRKDFSQYLASLLGTIITTITIDPIADINSEMKSWVAGGVFSRALLSADASIALLDVVGGRCYDLQFWMKPEHETTSP